MEVNREPWKREGESERQNVGKEKIMRVVYEKLNGALYRIPTDPWCKWRNHARPSRTSGICAYDPQGRVMWCKSPC